MTAACELYPMMELVPGHKRLWELKVDWCIELEGVRKGLLEIRCGFRFDGASIPQFLWSWIGSPMDSDLIRGALCHDFLYSAHLFSKKDTDQTLYDVLRLDGVGYVRANVIWSGPRLGGRGSWEDPTRMCMAGYGSFTPAAA